MRANGYPYGDVVTRTLHAPWVTAHSGALGVDVAGRVAAAARIDAVSATEARRVVDRGRRTVRLPAFAAPGADLDLTDLAVRASRSTGSARR